MRHFRIAAVFMIIIIIAGCAKQARLSYPFTKKRPGMEFYHGYKVIDDYLWLEDGESEEVQKWTAEQTEITNQFLNKLPQKEFLMKRIEELWRIDDEGIQIEVKNGSRIFYWVQKADDDKRIYYMKENRDAEPVLVINPNELDFNVTIDQFEESDDGEYVAIGFAKGGNENPIIKILDVNTMTFLEDTLLGWMQRVTAWLPDNSGFYYVANPLPGTVPEGDEYYWSTAYLHYLGMPADSDKTVFGGGKKEYFHGVEISENGKYLLFYKYDSNANEIYVADINNPDKRLPVVTGFENEYTIDIVDDRLLITTDEEAPMYQVFITDAKHPGRENWKSFIPQDSTDKLVYISPIAGKIYAMYQRNAYTVIKIFNANGEFLREMQLPTLGTAYANGYFSKPEVYVWFSSYTYPATTFLYDFENDSLSVLKKNNLNVNADAYETKQVWYTSKDMTPVSMFIIKRKDAVLDGSNPVLLTGYGGFNVSIMPYFSTLDLIWLEQGGIIARPNLRGGGEYGMEWHEAGMKENKQNVFDDFIYAGMYLIANGYTTTERLVISGGSNGGLLVGAVMMQRPDLFNAVDCSMPLLDMLRYHKFGYANIWASEYGSSDNPDDFKYLIKYSPYHNIIDGRPYPAMLITCSDNDARVDPLHARKMAAKLQDKGIGGPFLLQMLTESGHHGGTSLAVLIEQYADRYAFLMNYAGIQCK